MRFVSEADVSRVLTMRDAVDCVERALADMREAAPLTYPANAPGRDWEPSASFKVQRHKPG